MQKQLEEQPGVAAAQLCGFFKIYVCLFMLCLQDLLWMRKRKRAEGKLNVTIRTLQLSSLVGLCGRMKAALLSGPLHESVACVKSKQLVRTTK